MWPMLIIPKLALVPTQEMRPGCQVLCNLGTSRGFELAGSWISRSLQSPGLVSPTLGTSKCRAGRVRLSFCEAGFGSQSEQ